MKNKRKLLTVFLLSMGLIASLLTGCGNKKTPNTTTTVKEQGLKDGTYIGKGIGYGGDLSLEVVVKNNKIGDIKMVEHEESSPVFSRAFPLIKERIIEDQTPIVDSVSAATFSSYAVKTAVNEALKEAGEDFGDIKMDTAPKKSEPKQLEEVKTQMVVVGGGPSGLSAAISAKQSGVDNVILVEKLDILSGNGKFDMNFFDMINSKAQKEEGVEITVDDFLEMKEKSSDSNARKKVWAQGAYEVDEWLRGMGINLNHPYGGTNHMAEADAYAGEHIQELLEKKAIELNVDIRTGTKGLDIIMEDGKSVGVKVENREGYYDIKADAVVIATGGFSANKELLAKYAPGAERVETSNQMGATGDFVEVFNKHDLKTDHMDVLSVFKLIIKNKRDLTGAGDGFMLVNKNGERFAAENNSGLELAHTILDQPDGKVYYIYDQPLQESFYRLQKHNDLGYHTKAATLEELANKLSIDKDNFLKTVEIYNKAIDKEIKDPFRGDDIFDRKFAESGPYYGVQVESAIHMTKGGVVANEKAQILNTSDKPVEGLYASGEVTATSGAYSASVVFGRISGQEAAKYILEK